MPATPPTTEAEVVYRMQMRLGEGPLWDANAQVLYWTDLISSKLYRGDPSAGTFTERTLARRVPRVTPCRDGRLLFSFTRGPALGTFEGDTFDEVAPGFKTPDAVRMNDGACDALGRFWSGSYDPTLTHAIGSIYCFEPGRATEKVRGVRLSNGIRFSPDSKTMYFVDSMPGQIWAYNYDLQSAELGERRLLVSLGGTGVKPDGCTIDTDGCLWVAEVGRGRVARYTPSGELDQVVSVPVRKPTSVCFGGPRNDVLYITSRYSGVVDGVPDDELAGSLFAAQVGATGLQEYRFDTGRP